MRQALTGAQPSRLLRLVTVLLKSKRDACAPVKALQTHPFSECERSTAPAARNTSERGTMRSASTIKKFSQPETTELFPRFNARNAVSTTSSTVWDVRAGGRCMCEAAKKFVSVTPGQSAITLIPWEIG